MDFPTTLEVFLLKGKGDSAQYFLLPRSGSCQRLTAYALRLGVLRKEGGEVVLERS